MRNDRIISAEVLICLVEVRQSNQSGEGRRSIFQQQQTRGEHQSRKDMAHAHEKRRSLVNSSKQGHHSPGCKNTTYTQDEKTRPSQHVEEAPPSVNKANMLHYATRHTDRVHTPQGGKNASSSTRSAGSPYGAIRLWFGNARTTRTAARFAESI